MTTFDTGEEFVQVDGQIVEKDALLIAERLKEYDPNLEILCLDPMKCDFNEAPFVVCERKPDGTLSRVFECWQLDNTIIERVMLADKHQFDPSARFDSIAQMASRLKADRYKDRQGELADILKVAVSHKKSSFKVHNYEGDLVKIDERNPKVEKVGRSHTY